MPEATKVAAGCSTTEHRPAARRTIRSHIILQDENYPVTAATAVTAVTAAMTLTPDDSWRHGCSGGCASVAFAGNGAKGPSGPTAATGAAGPSNSAATTVNAQAVLKLLLKQPTPTSSTPIATLYDDRGWMPSV
jgi:hypothetical protein